MTDTPSIFLNQHTAFSASSREPQYDRDGNLITLGDKTYTYDAENRLVAVAVTNAPPVLANTYDHQHRRVHKATPSAAHNFVYDGWNLIRESVLSNGTVSVIDYFWGNDISGTLQGAGGVGGLLAASIEGQFYFAFYDNNGNITEYIDESGAVRAHYEYSPFGEITAQSGDLVDTFRFRFSTKYHDSETGQYYYGRRFYDPSLGRWLNRDPIEEEGGLNLYGFCGNNPGNNIDGLGLSFASFYHVWRPNDQYFASLERWLRNDLRSLCPDKGEVEWNYPFWPKKRCCAADICRSEADDFATAYVNSMKNVWLAEYNKHGNVRGGYRGNRRVNLKNPWGDEKPGYGDDSSDCWIDGNGLKCGGWAHLGDSLYNKTMEKSSCWFGTVVTTGRTKWTRHAYFVLKSPKGEKKLDPWASGGTRYE